MAGIHSATHILMGLITCLFDSCPINTDGSHLEIWTRAPSHQVSNEALVGR